ncbi:MAG: efflux RND transporter permease subunit, partial [Paracoccus sp. (in: a-proteobacteria)]
TRGLRPAIIDAVCDRFRPVLLTTATTVLGLAPLLYERSSQALFLKPTVVTLVYGLGFGMLIVLLVVPAVLGIGADIGRARQAFRRSLRAPVLGGVVRLAVAGAVLAFAVTLLPVTLLPALGIGLPGWWPLAGSVGTALMIYALLLVAVVVTTAAIAARRGLLLPRV